MSKLLIHIGSFKTGSTALQQFFAHHAVPGVQYLKVARAAPGGRLRIHHSDLHRALTGEFGSDTWKTTVHHLKAQIVDEISKSPGNTKFLISSEYLSHAGFLRRRGPESLRVVSGDAPVQIALYVRNRLDHFESYFYQECKRGNFLETPEEFLAPYMKGPGARFSDVIDAYSNVFGHDNVKIINYDVVRANLVGSIFRVLGVEAEEVQLPRLNDTPSVLSNMVLQEVARTLRASDASEWRSILERLARFANKLQDERPVTVISKQLRADVTAAFASDSKRLFEEFGLTFKLPSCAGKSYQSTFDLSHAKSILIGEIMKARSLKETSSRSATGKKRNA